MSIYDYQNDDGTLDRAWRDEFDELDTLEDMEDFFGDLDPVSFL